jgi:hypothetical protein
VKKKLACFITLVTLFTNFGCKPESQDHECEPDNCGAIGGPDYYSEPNAIDYISPVFNQSNNHEFIAMRIERAHDTVPEKVTLEKFDYINGTKEVILSNQMLIDNNIGLCEFNWADNGWIVFHDCNTNKIFKVKDDGSNLQQLAFDGSSYLASFTYDGTKIFFSNFSGTYNRYFGILMDINTNAFLDTIYNPGYIGSYNYPTCLSNHKIVCSQGNNHISIIDENGLTLIDEFSPIINIDNFVDYYYFRNIGTNTNEVIFNAGYTGICKINLSSHNATLIKSSCVNRYISALSVSPDGSKIVYQLDKKDTDEDDECHVKVKSEFHIMNIDGTNDQVLSLP